MSAQPRPVLPWVVRQTRPLDPLLARRNHVTLNRKRAWRPDTPSALLNVVWPVQVKAGFEAPVPVRPERLIGDGLDPNRNEARRRIRRGIPLRGPTSAALTFAVRARAYQRGRRRRG
jgi:hypothetical protein